TSRHRIIRGTESMVEAAVAKTAGTPGPAERLAVAVSGGRLEESVAILEGIAREVSVPVPGTEWIASKVEAWAAALFERTWGAEGRETVRDIWDAYRQPEAADQPKEPGLAERLDVAIANAEASSKTREIEEPAPGLFKL